MPRSCPCVSAPHPAHPSSNVDAWLLAGGGSRRCVGCRERPSCLLEKSEQTIGDETGSRRINVAVALCMLAVRKKALWHEQMQIILGARHRGIKSPALLLHLRCRS